MAHEVPNWKSLQALTDYLLHCPAHLCKSFSRARLQLRLSSALGSTTEVAAKDCAMASLGNSGGWSTVYNPPGKYVF